MNEHSQRQRQLRRVFEQRFGAAPTLGCRAPGRVDLMGSHTDYNLGYVLTLPIDLDTWIGARPRTDRTVRLYSMNLDAETTVHLDHLVPDPEARWTNYVRGVAQVLQTEGFSLTGWDGIIHSTVPMSSGLSSSAALECATATLFEALGGWTVDPVKKALLCQRAENQFVGVNCGILDQFTSCAAQEGCALLLDCRDLSSRPVKLVDELRVVICDTKSRRELAGSAYGQRREQCEAGARRLGVAALRDLTLEQFKKHEGKLPAEVAKRCRFIVEENARVKVFAEALEAGDRNRICQLCADSFHGAMTLYEIGSPAMHAMMHAMLNAPGVIGARQAGAGFGGCMVALVEAEQTDVFARAVAAAYGDATGVQPEIHVVKASAGTETMMMM